MVKVSVIVPVYNTAPYLGKCLDSLVRQTLDGVQIIVVDDGSTDASADIINDFRQRFPDTVSAFKKENGGLSDARNFGLDRAEGEFIGFVDSDDYVSEDMFADMYRLAKLHSAGMVICNLQKVDERGNVTQKLPQLGHLPEKVALEQHFSVFSDIAYFACNKLFRRSLFDGKRFKRGVHFEDIQLIPQLLLQCETVAHTEAYHYQYFERSGSITKTHNARGLDMLAAVEDVSRAFSASRYRKRQAELKNFKILEGVYSFLAYAAFVKDKKILQDLEAALQQFCTANGISAADILGYRRFGKNYFLGLPFKKKIYYLLCFSGIKMSKFLR